MPDDESEALRESDRRYRTLFEQAPVGVFLYDRALIVTDFNPRLVSILHSRPERLQGLELRLLRDGSLLPTLEKALRGESAVYEGEYAVATGDDQVVISLRVAPLRDGRGAVVGGMGLVEDVSDRVHAESALRTSEQRLALHVRRNPLGVVGFDPEGHIVEWNASAARIFGWSEDEALGKKGGDLAPPSARETVRDVFRALLARRGGERSMNHNLTKDGRLILCDWYNTALADDAGRVIGVASIVDDVTERHQTEKALKLSETRFRTLIENTPDAIVVYPPDERRIAYANPALASMLGYGAPQELVGSNVMELIHPDDRPILEQRSARLVETHGMLPPQEYRLLRKDGGTVYAEIVSMVLEYDGQPNVISFGRDLTEHKQMQARLLLADRMVSVGTLAAGIAHEINNPLAYVMSNLEVVATRRLPPLGAQLLEMGGAAADIGQEIGRVIAMVGVALEGSERMRDIVRDLRTFTRGADQEKRAAVDVRHVLDASINLAWNELRHRARLEREYGDVPPVLANEARLGQVFLNILVNAAQALEVGHAAQNVIRVRTATDAAGNVVVQVSDTGPGMSPDTLGRIFDPFFTTKPVGAGTGLGLWICQGIVMALAGQITAESSPGEGATFRVVLPPASATTGAPTRASPAFLPSEERHRYHVLVVDDEAAIGRTLAIALADDFQVSTATSGREALAILGGAHGFDVVLCDLMMPDVSGMDVHEHIARTQPALAQRFIFVTGGAFTERARKFVDEVGLPVLEKPFDLSSLPALLRERVLAASIRDGVRLDRGS